MILKNVIRWHPEGYVHATIEDSKWIVVAGLVLGQKKSGLWTHWTGNINVGWITIRDEGVRVG